MLKNLKLRARSICLQMALIALITSGCTKGFQGAQNTNSLPSAGTLAPAQTSTPTPTPNPITPANSTCLFNGQTLLEGQEVLAFQSELVPFSAQCQSEKRICTKGNLSGSFAFSKCTVAAAKSCVFNGQSIANGGSVVGWKESKVSLVESCIQETRTCMDGILSGSFANANCTKDINLKPKINATSVWKELPRPPGPVGDFAPTLVHTSHGLIAWGGASLDSNIGRINLGYLFNYNTRSWKTISTVGAPTARLFHGAVWTGKYMMVYGGDRWNTGGLYDPVSDTWKSISPSPLRLMKVTSLVYTGTKVIALGDRSIQIYDLSSDTWTVVAPLAGRADGFNDQTIGFSDSKLFYFSDESSADGIFDFATNSWTPFPKEGAPVGRFRYQAVGNFLIEGFFLVWGGFSLTGGVRNDGAIFDSKLNQWKALNLVGAPPARFFYEVVLPVGNELLVLGGSGIGISGKDATLFNPATNSWTPLPSAKYVRQRPAAAAYTPIGLVVLGGGIPGEPPEVLGPP